MHCVKELAGTHEIQSSNESPLDQKQCLVSVVIPCASADGVRCAGIDRDTNAHFNQHSDRDSHTDIDAHTDTHANSDADSSGMWWSARDDHPVDRE